MVLDSLGMMSTNKEMQDSHDGKDVRDMTKAQVIKGTFRTLTLKLARAEVPLLITNHIYQVVGSYVPTQDMGGGSGLKYAASTIAFLSKKKVKEGTDITGNIIKVKMNKSRLSKENKQVELLLDYKKGLSKWYGLLEFAEQKGIVDKAGARYKFPDEIASVFAKHVYEKPEEYFTESIMEKIEEAVKEEFKYGQ